MYYEHLEEAAQNSHLGRKKWAGLWQIRLYFKQNLNSQTIHCNLDFNPEFQFNLKYIPIRPKII